MLRYALSCGKVHIKDPLLHVGKSSLCGNSGFPLKKYVTMTTCLMSNSQWYENQCALEESLNKTNFLGFLCVHIVKQHDTNWYKSGIYLDIFHLWHFMFLIFSTWDSYIWRNSKASRNQPVSIIKSWGGWEGNLKPASYRSCLGLNALDEVSL